jgi:hypothetical protein
MEFVLEKLSVYIVTFNEEARLERTLKAAKQVADEIVVVDGKEQVRKICEFGINIDERVADGFYFAKCIKMCEHLFKHPEMLEEKVGTKIEIGNIR